MTTAIQLPTDQKFGGFVAGIFGLLAAYGFWAGESFLGFPRITGRGARGVRIFKGRVKGRAP